MTSFPFPQQPPFQKRPLRLPRAGAWTSFFPLAAGSPVELLRNNDADETTLSKPWLENPSAVEKCFASIVL